jgi:hypothetical protein
MGLTKQPLANRGLRASRHVHPLRRGKFFFDLVNFERTVKLHRLYLSYMLNGQTSYVGLCTVGGGERERELRSGERTQPLLLSVLNTSNNNNNVLVLLSHNFTK